MSNTISATVDRIVSNPVGGTAHLVGRSLPTDGYFVGGAGSALVFRTAGEVDRYLATQFMLRASAPYVGWWIDQETRKLYIDQVEWFPFLVDARREAAHLGEIAFWDIAAGREVRV